MWDVVRTAAAGIATDGVAAIPGGISMYDQVTAHDAVSNANVDAYNQYVKTSRDNAGSLPTCPARCGQDPRLRSR